MVTADTSVVVPSLASWHERHELAAPEVAEVERLPAHVVLESVSVLTRLPGGLAQPLSVAVEVMRLAFPGPLLMLPEGDYRDLFDALVDGGRGGGAVYDGLVAATARNHRATLLSLDRRAAPTYRAIGADVRMLA